MKSFVALVLALLPFFAHGQAWPARPVTIYLSNSAGSSPDIVLRQLTERLTGFGFGSSGAGTPETIRAFMRGERENWQRIVKELNLQAQ